MKIKCVLLGIISSLILLGCSENSSEIQTSSSSISSSTTSSVLSSSSFYSTSSKIENNWAFAGEIKGDGKYLDLFNPSSKVSIEVSFSDEVAAFMSEYQCDYSSKYNDVYFPANIRITINNICDYIEDVGIRMKGNTSRTKFYANNRFTNAFHFKVSFKATFDSELYDLPEIQQFKRTWESKAERKERKNRTYAGLEKLDFKYLPRNWRQGAPGSNCVEMYSYKSFRDAGLLAPYATACSMKIFSESASLSQIYEIVEPVDEKFLQKRFSEEDSKGDLYKCCASATGPADFTRADAITKEYEEGTNYNIGTRIAKGKIGVEDCYTNYHPSYDLKTNDNGENSDFSKMVNLINSIYNVANAKAPKTMLENVIDIDYFLAFQAMCVLLGNPDDLRYNSNNYYTYFVPSTGKAYFIAFDYDWSLGWYWDGCVNGDLQNKSIWNEEHQLGSPYIFNATIFYSGNTSYSKSAYQAKYKWYVYKYMNDLEILNFENYKALSNEYGKLQQNEFPIVQSYMENKEEAVLRS